MLEAVKQWAFTLVITAVIGSLASSLTISSDSNGMKKYVRFACALVALAVMVMPIRELFREMPRLFDFGLDADPHVQTAAYDGNAGYSGFINELTAAKTTELLNQRISDIVYEKTGIKPDHVHIYMKHKDYSELEVEKIVIAGDAPINSEELEQHLRQLFGCEVEIALPDMSGGRRGG